MKQHSYQLELMKNNSNYQENNDSLRCQAVGRGSGVGQMLKWATGSIVNQ